MSRGSRNLRDFNFDRDVRSLHAQPGAPRRLPTPEEVQRLEHNIGQLSLVAAFWRRLALAFVGVAVVLVVAVQLDHRATVNRLEVRAAKLEQEIEVWRMVVEAERTPDDSPPFAITGASRVLPPATTTTEDR